MCCFNVPFTIALMWLWSNPYADEDDGWSVSQILSFPFLLVLMPVMLTIDVLTFPFHFMNVIMRRCLSMNPSPDYWYEHILCAWRERTSVYVDHNGD